MAQPHLAINMDERGHATHKRFIYGYIYKTYNAINNFIYMPCIGKGKMTNQEVKNVKATISRSTIKRQYNKARFEVLEGNDTLVIVDHQKGTISWFKPERVDNFKEEGRSTREYVEDALLTNGWKHLRNVEDGVSE